MPKKQIPLETIVDLRRRLDQLPRRSHSRRVLVQEIAELYGISEDTVYRTLRENNLVHSVRRSDCDRPRSIPRSQLEARVTVEGVAYEVEPDLAGETVVLWWGLFDNQLYVEHKEHRYGPFLPVEGPIPLHKYRSFKKTRTQKRAERIEELAKQLSLPKSAIGILNLSSQESTTKELKVQPFIDSSPWVELTFSSVIAAKLAIAEYLARPLAKLPPEQMAYIESVCSSTLNKQEIMDKIRDLFNPIPGNHHAE